LDIEAIRGEAPPELEPPQAAAKNPTTISANMLFKLPVIYTLPENAFMNLILSIFQMN
jgi:hypothetical protein